MQTVKKFDGCGTVMRLNEANNRLRQAEFFRHFHAFRHVFDD